MRIESSSNILKMKLMKTNTDFARHLGRFFTYYLPHERNLSPNTIESYREAFVQLVCYYRDVLSIKVEKFTLNKLTRENIQKFLDWLIYEHKCSIATRNYRLAAIHSFVYYLQYEDVGRMDEWQKITSIKAMKKESPILNYLTLDGIRLLLEQPDAKSRKGLRHLAMLGLMYETGCRVQELIDLMPESLRISSKPYSISIYGKGRKTRIVPLFEEQLTILRKYMDVYRLNDDKSRKNPLFFNSRGEKLTRAGVTFILKRYVDMARIQNPSLIPENVSCHTLRHSRAMALLQSGVNLVYIKSILGHESLQTTDVYARADSKQKREALERAYQDVLPEVKSSREWENNQDLLDWLDSLKN